MSEQDPSDPKLFPIPLPAEEGRPSIKTRQEAVEYCAELLDHDHRFREVYQQGADTCACDYGDLCVPKQVLALIDGKATFDQQRDVAVFLNNLMVSNDQLKEQLQMVNHLLEAVRVLRGFEPQEPGQEQATNRPVDTIPDPEDGKVH